MDAKFAANALGDFLEVRLVVLGDDDFPDATLVCREQLLLHTADGKHAAAQADLTGHRHIQPHRALSHRTDHRSGNRDPRAGAVLGCGAVREVDVQVKLLVELRIRAVLVRVGAQIGNRGLHRFLHHVTQRSGHADLAASRGGERLDEQHRAAHAGPGQALRHADLRFLLHSVGPVQRHAQVGRNIRCVDHLHAFPRMFQQFAGRFAGKLADLPVEVAHAALGGVLLDDAVECGVGDFQLAGQAVAPQLPRHPVAPRNLHLLCLGVTGDVDDFHAVKERPRNRLKRVRRGDEHHLREVIGHFEVVVLEGVILLGVQHFQHRARRVAAPVTAHLVDLVKQDDRVGHARRLHCLDDAARHRADVGAAVAANLGLVPYAAQRHAHELAVERTGDALAQRGLAHTRRANQHQDRGAQLVVGVFLGAAVFGLTGLLRLMRQLAHRQKFQDAVFDVAQRVVIGVEDVSRAGDVEDFLVTFAPRHID